MVWVSSDYTLWLIRLPYTDTRLLPEYGMPVLDPEETNQSLSPDTDSPPSAFSYLQDYDPQELEEDGLGGEGGDSSEESGYEEPSPQPERSQRQEPSSRPEQPSSSHQTPETSDSLTAGPGRRVTPEAYRPASGQSLEPGVAPLAGKQLYTGQAVTKSAAGSAAAKGAAGAAAAKGAAQGLGSGAAKTAAKGRVNPLDMATAMAKQKLVDKFGGEGSMGGKLAGTAATLADDAQKVGRLIATSGTDVTAWLGLIQQHWKLILGLLVLNFLPVILLFVVALVLALGLMSRGDMPPRSVPVGSMGAVTNLDIPAEFNPNMVISDNYLLAGGSMSVVQIQSFLESTQKEGLAKTPSSMLGEGANGRTAAQIIYAAAQGPSVLIEPGLEQPINPQVLLMYLQKETSLLTAKMTDSNYQSHLDKAMGFNWNDSGSQRGDGYKGFTRQVQAMADQYRRYIRNIRQKGYHLSQYQINKAVTFKTVDPSASGQGFPSEVRVVPQNMATVAIYTYTPHVYMSSYNVWRISRRYFAASAEASSANRVLGSRIAGNAGFVGSGATATLVRNKITHNPIHDSYMRRPSGGQTFGASRDGGRRRHAGIDLGTGGKSDVPVYAAGAGRVVNAYRSQGAAGCTVNIDHGDGIFTRYMHLQTQTPTNHSTACDFKVKTGDQVEGGTLLGYASNTGLPRNGRHLHFEVRIGGPMGSQFNPTGLFNYR